MYTNAVAQATAGHDVLLECEASRAMSQRLEEAACRYTNAVVQATAGRNVFCTAPYLLGAQSAGEGGNVSSVPVHDQDMRLGEEDHRDVRWSLAREDRRQRKRKTQPCSLVFFSSFEVELLSLDVNGETLVAGAQRPGGDVNTSTQAACSPEVHAPCLQPSLQSAGRGAGQSGVITAPQTPEIMLDRGRSPSADSVPSPEQDVIVHISTEVDLLRNVGITCTPDGATCTHPVANEAQVSAIPTSQPAHLQPQEQVAHDVQSNVKEKPRKRRYMPKILDGKLKGSRAKKPRRGKECEEDTLVLNFEASSPTVLQMKTLARHKWAEVANVRPYVKRLFLRRRKKPNAPGRELGCEPSELERDPRILDVEHQAHPTTNAQNCQSSRCLDPLLEFLNQERECPECGEENCARRSATQNQEISKYLQESLFSEHPTENHVTSLSQVPVADQESSNCRLTNVLLPPELDFTSDVFMQAILRIPGNDMSSEELRNALNPVSACHNGLLDNRSADHNCHIAMEEFLAVDELNRPLTEDSPSTPRGAVQFVSLCQDFTLVVPPPSPPSPSSPQASDWNRNGEFSRISASTTRRTLKFDGLTNESQLEESKMDAKGAKDRNEGDACTTVMTECGSPQVAAHISGFALQVTEEDSVPAYNAITPFANVVMSLAKGSNERCAQQPVPNPSSLHQPSPHQDVQQNQQQHQAQQHQQQAQQATQKNQQQAPCTNADVPPTIDSSVRREEELQIVAYDGGAKKMVVYKNPPGRKRRVRYKPKVNLDISTVKMFKTLTIKGSGEDDTHEQEKASWEQARQQWQNRAHRFISIMREVQGNRSFSRWKGSVLDSVGGAFLTQNVSDFLSSNAFMALRARFPARRGTAAREDAGMSTPLAEAPPPVEHESTISRPERPTVVELKKQQIGDDQRREESSERAAALPSNDDVDENACVHEALTEIVERLRTRLKKCHIEHKDGLDEVLRPIANEEIDAATILVGNSGNGVVVMHSTRSRWQESGELLEAVETQTSEIRTQRFLTPFLGTDCTSNENDDRSYKKGDELFQLSVVEERVCAVRTNSLEEAGMPSSLVHKDVFQPDHMNEADCGESLAVETREDERPPPGASSWNGKIAVIQEKFAHVVKENVSSLTMLGKEKLLAATLRLVLGKKQTTREGKNGRVKALKNLNLRPARAVMRSKTDNYRYRHNVSFRLLSGESRASWEAGFVMKSQKEKWEPLRANILADENYFRDPLTDDCVDWEAVQRASVHEVADVIKNRGQHNALSGRLKAFLDRVHRDQNGALDLEWIRKLPPEDAKAFLLSFRGVGLKSVECIRLLCLHHPSFPVDTNVGRIAVRLGWVPLEPLPEETQLHLLELYPIQAHIQQYIWPRLCTLDQQTLYELHYQMITFGKVFCTKSKPNCNACPLRSECKHYASSYASAKLLLKWPEKPQDKQQSTVIELPGPDPGGMAESTQQSTLAEVPNAHCVPIIEEPRSPELEPYTDNIPDIEEIPFCVEYNTRGGPYGSSISPSKGFSLIIEELRSILDMKETTLDLNNDPELEYLESSATDAEMPPPVVNLEEEVAMELTLDSKATAGDTEAALENSDETIEEDMEVIVNTVVTMENSEVATMEITEITVALENTEVTIEEEQEGLVSIAVPDDFNHLPSQELILLPPQACLAPAPKLKNVQRLRTVHFVYELPDNHPLLFDMDKREPDDPCFYLLAIWSPDEVPEKMPKINDDDVSNPFASCQDNDPEQTVRGTLLIPCKTAMRGWFPLNGTYFQVNEVFADHASSLRPIDVPRTLLWSLRRRFVYFSTAVSNLFKDMSQEEIQCCFQKGYVCLRAFDLVTRQPKLLAPRLHQSGAKIVKAPASRKGRGPGSGRPRKSTPKGKPKSRTTPDSSASELAPVLLELSTDTVVAQIDF